MYLNLSHVNGLSLKDAAKTYAALYGFRVFRLRPGSKRPFAGSNGFHDATDDLATLERWWTECPGANIGLVTGDQYDLVDLDTKGGSAGWLSWLEIGGDHNHPMQSTPSGGQHVLIPRMDWLDLHCFSLRGAYGGLDLRTVGGYFVGAPSRTPDGMYRWRDGPVRPPSRETCNALVEYAKPKGARGPVINMPEPELLEDFEVDMWLSRLPSDERLWLTAGVNWREDGDTSAAAWQCVLAMAKADGTGWPLERIARIGPETTLATFGTAAPHHAPNPWAWAWKYTVCSAWRTAQADRERILGSFESTQGVGEVPATGGDAGQQRDTVAGDAAVAKVATAPSLNELDRLRQQVLSIQPGQSNTHAQVERILREAVFVGLNGTESENLRQTAVRSLPDVTMGWVKQVWGTLIAENVRARIKRGDKLADVYVLDQARILSRESGSLICREAFLIEKARDFGGDRAQAEAHYLIGRDALCEVVSSMTYHPGKPSGVMVDDQGVRKYNTYHPPSIVPAEGDVSPWLHLLDQLDLENEQVRDGLLDYMAWVVQRPETKVNHGILMGGVHGAGKDSLWLPIMQALGERNVTTIPGESLTSDFSGYLTGTKLLAIQEVEFGDHKDAQRVSAKLKPVLASPPYTLRVNEKNVREYDIPNLIQTLAFTNHRTRPVHMDPGERRWLAVWCGREMPPLGSPEREEVDAWFEKYYGWLENGGVSAVFDWLLKRDLSKYRPQAPPMMTTWALDIQDAGRSSLTHWLLDQIAERQGLFSLDFVRPRDVRDVARTAQQLGELSVKTLTDRIVSQAFEELGCTPIRVNNQKCWVIRPKDPRVRHKQGYRTKMLQVIDRVGVERAILMTHGERAAYLLSVVPEGAIGHGQQPPRWL